MIDNTYKNAFKEVYEILQNSEESLVKQVPQKFINFLLDNMNKDYTSNINTEISIDKQSILPETENILSLIFRSYWATDEEKLEFLTKDKQELFQEEENKKKKFKNINEIFKKKQNINNITITNDLIVIPKKNFIQKLFKKIYKIFKK